MHARWTHGFRSVPEPPRFGRSKQYLHVRHSSAAQPAQAPQRFLRGGFGFDSFEGDRAFFAAGGESASRATASPSKQGCGGLFFFFGCGASSGRPAVVARMGAGLCATAASTQASASTPSMTWPFATSLRTSARDAPSARSSWAVVADLYLSYLSPDLPVFGLTCRQTNDAFEISSAVICGGERPSPRDGSAFDRLLFGGLGRCLEGEVSCVSKSPELTKNPSNFEGLVRSARSLDCACLKMSASSMKLSSDS
mmetsp:Transcript_21313/g.72186  ORF Transcript_21313/g.72186 Transcript_21313/m.72186 type:complete len:253 (-) Transcript_21313:1102-1860(-)